MPYIKAEDRNRVMETIGPMTPGELNYAITRLCQFYIEEVGANYTGYNDVVGALECAKLEMYRRLIAPYEDTKLKENGDVY